MIILTKLNSSFNNLIELILWLFSREPRNIAYFVSIFSTTELLVLENFCFFIMKMKTNGHKIWLKFQQRLALIFFKMLNHSCHIVLSQSPVLINSNNVSFKSDSHQHILAFIMYLFLNMSHCSLSNSILVLLMKYTFYQLL